MASASLASSSGMKITNANTFGMERLPDEMNGMEKRDDKEVEAAMVDGNGTETRHIIVTTIGGRNGQPKQTISYMSERVVGNGFFGIVFQAKCLETGETIAIKKVLQEKRVNQSSSCSIQIYCSCGNMQAEPVMSSAFRGIQFMIESPSRV